MRARVTSVGVAALLVLSLSGCTFSAVQANAKPYDPSDGIGAEVGELKVRNALLISEDGEVGNLLINVVNEGTQSVSLTLSWEGATGQVDRNVYVKAEGTQSFGEEGDQIILRGIDAAPGSLFPIYLQYGDEEGRELMVPVLDGGLEEYADLVPTSTD